MRVELPKEITERKAEELLLMIFGAVPAFSLCPETLTIDNPTEQMELDAGMIADALKREMGLPVVDENQVRREELVSRVRQCTEGTGVSLDANDVRDAVGALAELVGVDLTET